MNKRNWMVWAAFLAATLMFQPVARADLSPTFSGAPQVSMNFVGGLSGDDGHYVISPYSLKVNNVPLALICNDAFDEIGVGNTWTAQVLHGWDTNFDTNILLTDFSLDARANLHMWDEDAYLKAQLLAAYRSGDRTAQMNYTYALWELFDSGFRPTWIVQSTMITLWNDANTAANTAANLGSPLRRSLTVYDPITYIGGSTTSGNEAQVFDTVPDGGMTLMLLGGVLVGLETLRRKFRV